MSEISKWLMRKNIRVMFGAAAILTALVSFYLYHLCHRIFALGFPISILIFILGLYLHHKLGRIAFINELRSQWGKPLKTERHPERIKNSYKSLNLKIEGSSEIDDLTWNDLLMDDIYRLMDRCHSSCGQVMLYGILRQPIINESVWETRRKSIHAIQSNRDFREKLQLILHKLGKQNKEQVERLLTEELPEPPKFWLLLEIVPYISLISFAASLLLYTLGKPELFAVPLILVSAISIMNAAIRNKLRKGITSHFPSIGYLSSIINAARSISTLSADDLNDQLKRLSEAYESCRTINNKTFALNLENVDPFGLYTYINVLFLIDIRMFFRVVKDINACRNELIALYSLIGELDALISIASFRDGYPSAVEPVLHNQARELELDNMIHPLIENPVPNSISLKSKGALITGSNMSGKSTFLRTTAVNVILAQTTCITFTSGYRGSFYRVCTSISQSDNMLGGKSYYLAEAETLLKMLNGIQPDIPTLCVIDEIFRGTNSRERIAAASQYLKYIAGLNALTMAATHDIELTDIVKDKFDIYYFAEDVSKEGLVFDYRLRHGVSPTRNAIKILDYLGYPEEIVSNSNAMIAGEEFISSH